MSGPDPGPLPGLCSRCGPVALVREARREQDVIRVRLERGGEVVLPADSFATPVPEGALTVLAAGTAVTWPGAHAPVSVTALLALGHHHPDEEREA